MKRIAIISIAIAATLVLVMGVGLIAYAAPPAPGGDWYCHFTENQTMDSNFKTATEIDDAVSGLQPGDDAVFHIEVQNLNDSATDWYMANEVLQSLEQTEGQTEAKGGAYSYDLRYVGPGGVEDVLYTSESVGGEGKTLADRVGLREATSALEDFFYLDTLAKGEKGDITLTVSLDGETQGNAYQDTMARLQMNFAVELSADQPAGPEQPDQTPTPDQTPAPGSTPTPDTQTTPPSSTPDSPFTPVRTGDGSNLVLWSGVMLACGLGVLALAVYSLRRSRKYREEDEDE